MNKTKTIKIENSIQTCEYPVTHALFQSIKKKPVGLKIKINHIIMYYISLELKKIFLAYKHLKEIN